VGEIFPPEPVLPIIAVLAVSERALLAAREAACRIVGPIALESEIFPFEWTRYYEAEMGPRILRRLIAARDLADPGLLVRWKIAAQAAEREIAASFAPPPARPANLDPGYLAPSKLVLASTKDFAHRIYLSDGIYAEITLRCVHGRFEPLPHTYPDWRSGRYDPFLREARLYFRERLRSQKRG